MNATGGKRGAWLAVAAARLLLRLRGQRGFHGGLGGTRFPGMEPLGDFPIHIIVKNGHVTLEGVVNSQADKDAATVRANGVSGVFSVENHLQVQKS